MKSISIPQKHIETIKAFVAWFEGAFDLDDFESKIAINRLKEKANQGQNDDSVVIKELEIWFLKNYLQSAQQDEECPVDKNDLQNLLDLINSQTK